MLLITIIWSLVLSNMNDTFSKSFSIDKYKVILIQNAFKPKMGVHVLHTMFLKSKMYSQYFIWAIFSFSAKGVIKIQASSILERVRVLVNHR